MTDPGTQAGRAVDDQRLTSGADQMCGEIAKRCPNWSEAAGDAFDKIAIAARVIIDGLRRSGSTQTTAVLGIVSQAVSDYLDLLVDAASGRGRPALRAARSLVEEHVAVLDCSRDLQSAARWLDSGPTADVAIANLTLPERHLRGKALKGYRHRIDAAGKIAERALTEAAAQWGGRFRSSWHAESMRARTKAHGLDDAYEFYRLASAPVHASSGGSMGLRKIRRDGGPTVRTGFALEAVPIAILYGTAAMRAILSLVEEFVPGGLAQALSALEALDQAWEELYEGIQRLEQELWPSLEPVNRAILIVIAPGCARTCYELLPELWKARTVDYDKIDIHASQERSLDAILQYLADFPPDGRVGIFVHEAGPSSPPDDLTWGDAEYEIDDEIHVRTDGTILVGHEPEADK